MRLFSLLVIVLAAFMLSCSGNSDPVVPGTSTPANNNAQGASGPVLWGYYDLYFDIENTDFSAVPDRNVTFTSNIVQMLNQNPASLSLTINSTPIGASYVDIDCDITITHPIASTDFTGYDVRGIFIGNGSKSLGYSGLTYANHGTQQILTNADGYTRWYNPTEFTVPGLFGYVEGALAKPGYLGTATLNPYKYFSEGCLSDEGAYDFLISGNKSAGYFYPESSNTRNYVISFPMPSPGIRYGYAIVANWSGVDPDDHPSHSIETPAIYVDDKSDLYWNGPSDTGGDIILDISVFDWNASPDGDVMDDYTITLETKFLSSPYTFSQSEMTPVSGSMPFYTYHVEITPDMPITLEDPEYWVIVEYPGTDYSNPLGVPNTASGPLAGYFRHSHNIYVPSGWTETWGGSSSDRGYGLATDDSGNSYTTGYRSTASGQDIFLSRHNNTGDMMWEVTFGSPSGDRGNEVAIDSMGNIYVTGVFQDVADFDPSAGVDEHTSVGVDDCFITKFDPHGNFIWAKTWGGTGYDAAEGIAVDSSDNIYVCGYFNSPVDFDAEGSGDLIDTAGMNDAYITAVDESEGYLWTVRWGGDDIDMALALCVDNSDNIHVTGKFSGTADFNPDGGSEVTASAGNDAYLSAFSTSGIFSSVVTWGGPGKVQGSDIGCDQAGNVYVAGYFFDSLDFDPGPGTDDHASNGSSDGYVTKFNESGNFAWTHIIGGPETDESTSVATDSDGNVFVTGGFYSTIDFDPGPGTDNHTSVGQYDVFLTGFSPDGSYRWTRTWGGTNLDMGLGLSTDSEGNIYTAGRFRLTFDFAPTESPCFDESDVHQSNGACDVFLSKHLQDGCW